MGIFDVFKKGNSNNKDDSKKSYGKHMPVSKLPIDDRFMKHFIENGGKFIYCENNDEVLESFDNILLENDWYETNVYCTNKHLKQKFSGFNLEFGQQSDAPFFIGNCEYLVANNGAILVSSDQLKEKKLDELPFSFIVFAGTSQLVEDISEGLRRIKSKSKTGIPSNITTIKHFGDQKSDDFLSYGSTTKNLYLLLLEDL